MTVRLFNLFVERTATVKKVRSSTIASPTFIIVKDSSFYFLRAVKPGARNDGAVFQFVYRANRNYKSFVATLLLRPAFINLKGSSFYFCVLLNPGFAMTVRLYFIFIEKNDTIKLRSRTSLRDLRSIKIMNESKAPQRRLVEAI